MSYGMPRADRSGRDDAGGGRVSKFLGNLKLLFWSKIAIWALDLSIFAMKRAGLQESVVAAIRRSRTAA